MNPRGQTRPVRRRRLAHRAGGVRPAVGHRLPKVRPEPMADPDDQREHRWLGNLADYGAVADLQIRCARKPCRRSHLGRSAARNGRCGPGTPVNDVSDGSRGRAIITGRCSHGDRAPGPFARGRSSQRSRVRLAEKESVGTALSDTLPRRVKERVSFTAGKALILCPEADVLHATPCGSWERPLTG